MSFGLSINHNLGSMNALAALNQNENSLQKALQQLSTGKKINSAADDAAGLAISQKMQGQINGLDQASQNAQNGISLIQTAEGALNETQNILQRMRQLAVEAANDTNTSQDRNAIQLEVNQLTSEVNRIANTTQFNTLNLLNTSSASTSLAADFIATLQIGANKDQTMQIDISNMTALALKISSTTSGSNFATIALTDQATSNNEYALDVSSQSTAENAIDVINNAIDTVSKERANLGAYQNRLEHTINNLTTSSQNLTTAQSGITDTDMASAMAEFTKDNVLQQAAVSMLAQANQQPQLVLKLLG